ncbi:hypothetical protein I4U23_012455 [Adineta vaga]|nr:hypothetical protein I4U23_012455 [Adineta vaga]
MDRSIQYAHVMSNFDSVYNSSPNSVRRQPHIFIPTSSFSSQPSQSISSSLNSSNPKFNFDLYHPNEYHLPEFQDYQTSPSSSVIIHHHHPVHSPPPSQAISKLRQINDELCYTLAQSDLPNYSQPSPTHYHVQHYPISHSTHHSYSSNQQDSSSESEEIVPEKHNARITYKVHIPRRRRQQQQPPPQKSTSDVDQLLVSTSDAYVQDDPLTVDIYPTRDQGYTRRIRNRPDNRIPWLPDEIPIRRNSYSEESTYRTPRAPDYDNQLIQPSSRLSDCKERPRSSSLKSRFRHDTSPNLLRCSASSFSVTAPVWRPNGSIKHPKFMGSNAPPTQPKPTREPAWKPGGVPKTKPFRAFDPNSKVVPTQIHEPVWHPPSLESKRKNPKYFEPTVKSEFTAPIRSKTEPIVWKKTTKQIPSGDPKLKTRIATAESKVKSAWENSAATIKPRPPIPRPVKPTPTNAPITTKVKSAPSRPISSVKKVVPVPATNTDTGRSSIVDVPPQPLFQSTPRTQSVAEDDLIEGVFGDDSKITVLPKEPPESAIKTTPTINRENNARAKSRTPSPIVVKPQKSSSKSDKDSVFPGGDDTQDDFEQDFDGNTSVNNADKANKDVSNNDEVIPSTSPPRKESSPKPDNRDDDPVVDDEDFALSNGDDMHEDDEQSFDRNPSANNANKANDKIISSTPPPPSGPTTNHDVDDFFD